MGQVSSNLGWALIIMPMTVSVAADLSTQVRPLRDTHAPFTSTSLFITVGVATMLL